VGVVHVVFDPEEEREGGREGGLGLGEWYDEDE